MPFLYLFLTTGVVLSVLMIALWLLSLAIKNASIIDSFWGLGFVLIAWFAYTISPQGYVWRKQLDVLLVSIWGLRLSIHILVRSWRKPEDFRYGAWRDQHGARWWWVSLFQVFLLQGVLLWILSVPVLTAQTSGFPAILTPLDFIGAVVWTVGMLFEAVADSQLARFKADPANEDTILTTGLWKYSRHPNYFGETMVWWGLYVIALAAGAWWTIISPLLLTFLLIRLSGVPMLERHLLLKPGYERYKNATSAFLPWLPRKR